MSARCLERSMGVDPDDMEIELDTRPTHASNLGLLLAKIGLLRREFVSRETYYHQQCYELENIPNLEHFMQTQGLVEEAYSSFSKTRAELRDELAILSAWINMHVRDPAKFPLGHTILNTAYSVLHQGDSLIAGSEEDDP